MAFNNFKSDIDSVMQAAWLAFHEYRKLPFKKRSELLRLVAVEIESLGDELISTCMAETNLPETRLRNERTRTIFQLHSYADACEKGDWLDVRIDIGDPTRNPPKPDIRKMQVPLGPVVIFGASNFPFAFSTAGGDTASALAAGCPVIVKAHPAHNRTSALVAGAIARALKKSNLEKGIFSHITGDSHEPGKALVLHRYTKAVAFTGSFIGGKAIWNLANARKEPIPVFAEMGSINPVFLLPGKLKEQAAELANMLISSITLGGGQFCTNPGIIIGVEGESLDIFIKTLTTEIKKITPVAMLHDGIAKNFRENRTKVMTQPGVLLLEQTAAISSSIQDIPSIASAKAEAFLANDLLKTEVFGSFSLIVRCTGIEQMKLVAQNMEGQLTATLMATIDDLKENESLVEEIKNHCGRLIVNNVPTGVEVCLGMHHGGPWPATTDSRFTSVGADAIKRFVRPLSFQNWPEELLPNELKNENPLAIWRTVKNQLTKEPVSTSE